MKCPICRENELKRIGDITWCDNCGFSPRKSSGMKLALIKDGEHHLMGMEIETGAGIYFVHIRQDLWPGVRIGPFPKRSDGTEFERVELAESEVGLLLVGGE